MGGWNRKSQSPSFSCVPALNQEEFQQQFKTYGLENHVDVLTPSRLPSHFPIDQVIGVSAKWPSG